MLCQSHPPVEDDVDVHATNPFHQLTFHPAPLHQSLVTVCVCPGISGIVRICDFSPPANQDDRNSDCVESVPAITFPLISGTLNVVVQSPSQYGQ